MPVRPSTLDDEAWAAGPRTVSRLPRPWRIFSSKHLSDRRSPVLIRAIVSGARRVVIVNANSGRVISFRAAGCLWTRLPGLNDSSVQRISAWNELT